MRSWIRVAAVACAFVMILVVFQSANARAHPPGVPGAEYNYALALNGGVASASGYYGSNAPGRAVDGSTSTYWQSSTKTGWLSVRFPAPASINEVHIHLRSTVLPSLSLYYDLTGDGDFTDEGERVWWTTTNGALDVVVPASAGATLGMQATIDVPVGKNKPQISEFEAYRVPPDSDGDGLTDDQEVRSWGTSPVAPDTDADGLNDGYEVVSHDLAITVDGVQRTETVTTDPLLWDNDRDGLSDGEEVIVGLDGYITDPTVNDTDSDVLTDGEESLTYFSSPVLTDTDADRLSDYDEVVTWATTPLLPDSDDDGLNDFTEVTTDRAVMLWFPQTSYGADPQGDQQGFLPVGLGSDGRTGWRFESAPVSDWDLNYYWSANGPLNPRVYLYAPTLDLQDALTVSVSFGYLMVGQGYLGFEILLPDGTAINPGGDVPTPSGAWTRFEKDLSLWSGSVAGFVFCAWSQDPTFRVSVDDVWFTAKTNPLVDDTDHDGLWDGEEVNAWSTNPVAADSDIDGVADFRDPSWGDDLSPRVLKISSTDFRQSVDIVAYDSSGIVHWQWWGQHLNGEMTSVSVGAVDSGAGQYTIVFNWDHFETIYGVTIWLFDAYGKKSELRYRLSVSPSDPALTTPTPVFFGFTETVPGIPVIIDTGVSGVLSSTASVVIGALTWVPLLTVVALLLISAPTSKAITDPGPADTELVPDTYPLATWDAYAGRISLYPGFSDTAGSLLRGTGWNFISALYPGITLDTIANILMQGGWTEISGVWVVTWSAMVSGVATLYRVLIENGVIFSLEGSEVVIDKMGTEVTINELALREHFYWRNLEDAAKFPTLEDYRNRIKNDLQNPLEIWYSTGINDPLLRKGYLYIASIPGDPAHKFITITDEYHQFLTAYLTKTEIAYHMAYSETPGARFEVPIYPLPPYR